MHLSELKSKHVSELIEFANSNEIEGANRMRKHDLIFALLKQQAKKGESIFGEGVLEVLARRLRLPALARHLVPRQHRRHLHLAVADPPLQPAHRRHDRRRDPHAEGRRALLRAGQGRQGQLRAAGERQDQDPVREPDAAVPGQDDGARAGHQGRGEHHRPHHRHRRADRQGPARPAGGVARSPARR